MFKHIYWSAINSLSNTFFRLLGIIVLSRLLSPQDYGILGVMVIFVAIGDMVVDSGMAGALIYKKDCKPEDYSTLFIYNLGVSVILYLLLLLLSPLLASWYGIDQLTLYLQVYALTLIISGFGVVQNAKLQKKLKFKTLAVINIIADFTSLGVAILLAMYGYGVWALIAQYLAFALVRVILLYIYGEVTRVLIFSKTAFKEHFSFGSWLLLSSIVNTASDNVYTSVIPKVSTIEQNGFFSQAYRICLVPVNIITTTVDRAIFPLLSKIENARDLILSARQYSRLIYFVAIPLFVIFSAISPSIVSITLGANWVEVIPYMELLFFVGIPMTIQSLMRNLLKSLGKTRLIATIVTMRSVITLAILLATSFLGMTWILYGILFSMTVNTIITVIVVNINTDYDIKAIVKDFLFPLSISAVCYILLNFASPLFTDNILLSFVAFILTYAIYFMLALVFKNKEGIRCLQFMKTKIFKQS